ncbi:MAG: HEAT repeat domain-containing protein [Aphanocapsa feldmannii 277cV]|uniref:HEAT repeat domain-containing protein n=1 Tax=Aphanocapsa feldmannii 277cV TaxID=2507553 RepID=A0A524RMQ4_9CHRO|nr:MAG: HEAT repeat domain-containing protein [Aphanocapsa feldmannii 277cV]
MSGGRFDNLFAWMDEPEAIRCLRTPADQLDIPAAQYVAATRLGAASSEASLLALLDAARFRGDDINNRLTRRKALEALGRRRDPRSLALVLKALAADDPAAVVNAANSVTALAPLDDTQGAAAVTALCHGLRGPGTQQRAVVQALTRLGASEVEARIRSLLGDPDPILDGAVRAYLARVCNARDLLGPVLQRLGDSEPGQRRTAVIDLGLAGDPGQLAAVVHTATSMPLRALAAFPLARQALAEHHDPAMVASRLDSLCSDDPRTLRLLGDPCPEDDSPEALLRLMLQRDENAQYGAARRQLALPRSEQLDLAGRIRADHYSDYGANYLLMRLIGLGRLEQLRDVIGEGLRETAPQYAKSRIAAAMASAELDLGEHIPLLRQLSRQSRSDGLRWASAHALQRLAGESDPAGRALSLRAAV